MNIEQIANEVSAEMSRESKAMDGRAMMAEFLRRCLAKIVLKDIEPFGYLCDWGNDSYGLQRVAVYYREPGSGVEDDWNESPRVHENLPIYTQTQLLAVQERTSEALCAEIKHWKMVSSTYSGSFTQLELELTKANAEIARLKEEIRIVKEEEFPRKIECVANNWRTKLREIQQEQQLHVIVESAFREGFRSPETYNDVVLNSEDEAWRKSEAFSVQSKLVEEIRTLSPVTLEDLK